MEDFINKIFALILFLVVIVIPSLILAKMTKGIMKRKHPECISFTWGYYLGYQGILTGFAMTIYFIDYMVNTYYSGFFDILTLVIFNILYIAINIRVLRRNRLAFIINTIFTFNPVIWIYNYIYIKDRQFIFQKTVKGEGLHILKEVFSKSVSLVKKSINKQQFYIIMIITNLIFLLLGLKIIDVIGYSLYPRYWQNPISNAIDLIWAWILLIMLIGGLNFFLLSVLYKLEK